MIRTFLFDMGNVLVRFSHRRMCAQMGGLAGLSADEMHELLLDSGLQWQFERGLISEEGLHRHLQEATARNIDFAALLHAGADIFEPNEPMPMILRALKQQGHRLVLLSNTSVSHFNFIMDRYDVLKHFDDYCLSFRVGAIKPEPAIFEAALELIGCEPQECFYTDDVPEYVAIGRSYGLQGEVFRDPQMLLSQLRDHGVEVLIATAQG